MSYVARFASILACGQAAAEIPSVMFLNIAPLDTGSDKAADHLVFAGSIAADRPLRVFMPGTGGHPSADDLLQSITKGSQPTIGLSYQSLPSADASRVKLCKDTYGADMAARAKCNLDQHADAVWGGNSQPKLWPTVLAKNSITGRLQLLLTYLDGTFPEQGWSSYLDAAKQVRWDRVVMGGHSQGGSMTAWMAQNMSLRGAVMLSGPQDDDEITDYWVDAPFATSRVVGAFHALESDSQGIRANLLRFPAAALGWPSGGEAIALGDGLSPIPYGPIVSNLPCCDFSSRPCHVSMGYGCVKQDGQALYALHLWPELYDHASSSALATSKLAV